MKKCCPCSFIFNREMQFKIQFNENRMCWLLLAPSRKLLGNFKPVTSAPKSVLHTAVEGTDVFARGRMPELA